AEHAHVVRAASVHATLGEFSTAEEVATTDDDRDLRVCGRRSDLLGQAADHIGVDAERAAAEGLTGELQQHPSLSGHCHCCSLMSAGCGPCTGYWLARQIGPGTHASRVLFARCA